MMEACCKGHLCHGKCADSDEYTCSSGFQSGFCAGAANIKCCSGTLAKKSAGCSGTCSDVNTHTCSNGFVSRRCPGASNIQCCTGTVAPKSAGCSGTCSDVNTHTCSNGFVAGKCPGASNIQCCTGTVHPKSAGCSGTCSDVNTHTCSNGFVSGKCPGASNIQCCTGTVHPKSTGCSGTCSDVNTHTCSNGFVAGKCPGASNIQCCTGTVHPKSTGCSGTCSDVNTHTCSNGFVSGKCPGASNIQCCTGTVHPKSTGCSGTCADIESNSCSNGFVAGRCPGASSIQCCTGTVTPSGHSGGCSYATGTWPNSATIAAFFRDTQGITNPKALAVIMGNLQQESNLNPLDCEAYGRPASSVAACPVKKSSSGYWMTGIGLLQWSDANNRPGRRSQLLAYCRNHGLNCDLASTQLRFLAQESEWARAKACFQAGGKEMGTTWNNAGATAGSYWQCAARWTGWGIAGSRAQYALQWLARCNGGGDSGCKCVDINSNTCSTGFVSGLCPGGNNIKCCKGTVTPKGSDSGSCQCADINTHSCSTGFVSGLCPGADNIRCCKGTLTQKESGSCQCADINSNTCSTGFVAGLCPGANNIQCCKGTLTPSGSTGGYNRDAALAYAHKHWNSPNHDCSKSYSACAPYSYWGGEHCGYGSHGGDCANFVSQCLLAGGHAPLNGGGPCRGYPCGREEIGAKNLGDCLAGRKGWVRQCGYHMPPPAHMKVGDVLVYHAGSCESADAHATIITSVSDGVRITCHSNEKHNEPYTYLAGSKPYYEWLHRP
eukprot:m51a1_g10260 hypothetical protein (774) ;mRNA; f:3068-6353